MMKLSKEERPDLRTGISKTLLFIIILSDFNFPQIPFKGFCKINSFEVDSGYTRLFSLNYDQDEYSDMLIYDPLDTKVKLYKGKSGINFDFIKEISFPFQPSRIEPIVESNNMIESYAFTSRKNRSFGICKFSNQGNPELLKHIKFDSYPEFISIADIDHDGSFEFLLSGNGFDGLSLIYQKGNKLEEQKILSGKTFLNAQFIDLNDDGEKDIVALSSVNNRLQFFYNYSNSEFSELREIDVNENVSSLHIFDVNYDSYPDIIVTTENSIKIYFGEALNSYENVVTIKTSFSVKDLVIGDYNRDGYFDFNCLDTSDGTIFTIFAKDFYSYYSEIAHTRDKGTVDIIPFFSKFVYGSAMLNKNGKVSILSKTTSISDNQTLAVGIAPNIISSFDLSDNGIIDLMFTDDEDQALKFIIRDAAGYPEKYFSAKLNNNYNKIIEFSNSKLVKTFYCFSYGKRIIEAVEVNFENYTYKHDYFYTEGAIEDIIVSPDENKNAEIFVLYSRDKSLNFEIFSKTTLRYSNKIYKAISYNWFAPVIVSTDDMVIGYWSKNIDYINFNLVDLKEQQYGAKLINRIKSGDFSTVSESNISSDYKTVDFLSLITGKNGIFLFNGMNNDIYSASNDKIGFRITNKNQLFFDKTNSVFVNNKKGKSFIRIKTGKTKKQLRMENIFENVDISNFIITSLGQRRSHLIYTDKNFINIKQLFK